MATIEVISSRDKDIENMTFTGIVAVCKAGNIDWVGRTLRDLKVLLSQDTTILLTPGIQYIKTSNIVSSLVKKVLKVDKSSSDTIIVEVNKELAENDEVAFSELTIEEQPKIIYRVPMSTGVVAKKKSITIVLRGNNTFLGAFQTKRDLSLSLDAIFPGIDVALFRTENGHEGVRVVDFAGTVLLNDQEIDEDQ